MKKVIVKHVKILLIVLSLLATALLGVVTGVFLVYQKGFSQIRSLEDIKPVVMSILLDDQRRPIKEFAIEKRTLVESKDIPQVLKNAIITGEDRQFNSHWGVSAKGSLRAVMGVLLNKDLGGGSTITMQLSRNLFLTRKFTIVRKIQEMLMSVQIERKYSKDQILTFYCNTIFFGGSLYGVEAASRYYFGKSVRDLDVAEAALLAAIIPSPNRIYSVFGNPANCRNRRNYILDNMLKANMITRAQYEKAVQTPLPTRPNDLNSESLADYFAEDTRKMLESKFGDNRLYKGGLQVETTLNRDMQIWAKDALQNALRALDKRRGWRSKEKLYNLGENGQKPETDRLPSWDGLYLSVGMVVEGVALQVGEKSTQVRIGSYRGEILQPDATWTRKPMPEIIRRGDVIQVKILTLDEKSKRVQLALEQEPLVEGAVLVVENKTGEIKAMVGGYSFARSKFNRATQAMRQTGSTFKPIIYTAALENGFAPNRLIDDSPFTFVDEWTGKVWAPHNHGGDYKGLLTFRRGLEQSRNVVTARILKEISPATGLSYARRFGISSYLKPYMSMSLGAFEVSLYDMVAAYTTFANSGTRVTPYFVRTIRDMNGNVLEENGPERRPVLDPQTAFIMNYVLQGVTRSGTAYKARVLNIPQGGKTGTTDDYTDAWFIGFTPTLTVGVWVGHDQKKRLGYEETGAKAALPVYIEFMQNCLKKYPETGRFPEPSGLVWCEIDKYTGKLAAPGCLYVIREPFLPGTEPREMCSEEEHRLIQTYYKKNDDDGVVED